jgi:AbrB family looped-hinge helix DNA binding protein
MSKITSKLQVTVPKAVAERFKMKPGDEIEWEAAGDMIRVIPATKRKRPKAEPKERVKIFDAATKRQREREAARGRVPAAADRGWTRTGLYEDRGGAR